MLNEFPKLPKDSREEVQGYLNYARGLIFKNQRRADEAATDATQRASYQLINAVFELPPYDGNSYSAIAERAYVIESYIEQNLYYIDVLERAGVKTVGENE